jgi:hypothetical protein
MKKRPMPRDPNQRAAATVRAIDVILGDADPEPESSKPPKNPAEVALGKLGGSKGGRARAAKLTPDQRSEIARKAAAKRWGTG